MIGGKVTDRFGERPERAMGLLRPRDAGPSGATNEVIDTEHGRARSILEQRHDTLQEMTRQLLGKETLEAATTLAATWNASQIAVVP